MQGVIFWGQVNELAEIILRKDSVFHKGKQKCLFFFIKKRRSHRSPPAHRPALG